MTTRKRKGASPPTPSEPGGRKSNTELARQYSAALPTFIAELAACGQVTAAAAHACVPRQWIYSEAKRNAEFAEAFEEAQHLGNLALEDEAKRRAFGWDEPVVYKGEPSLAQDPVTEEWYPVTVRKFSATLLIFLLKGAFPEKYKERSMVETTGGPNGNPMLDLSALSEEEFERFGELLRKAQRGATIEGKATEVPDAEQPESPSVDPVHPVLAEIDEE